MLASLGPKAVRETQKIGLVDLIEHGDDRLLGNLVFDAQDTERPLGPVGLRDVDPSGRTGAVPPFVHPSMQILEATPEILLVLPPAYTVHPFRRCSFELVKALLEQRRREVV